jgi:Galactosyltransferase
MKIRCHWLALFVLCALLLHWFGNGFIHFVIQRRSSLYVQFLDIVGIPSTVHMPDMSCSGCNLFNSRYIVDVPAGVDCSADNKIFLLVLVISQTENFNRRNTVRQTWGSVGEHKGRSIRTYFICGRSNNATVETQLAKEIAYWGDIVQVFKTSLTPTFIMICLRIIH